MGIIYAEDGDFDKALDYFKFSLVLDEEIGNIEELPNSYNNIGNIHYYLGDYRKSYEFQLMALKIQKQTGEVNGQAISLFNIGSLHIKRKENKKANAYLDSSIVLFNKISYLIGIRAGHKSQIELYKT